MIGIKFYKKTMIKVRSLLIAGIEVRFAIAHTTLFNFMLTLN
ncbi:MAG TPA: hypothetical protein V6C58_15970 [Allocoleopsis sp.]